MKHKKKILTISIITLLILLSGCSTNHTTSNIYNDNNCKQKISNNKQYLALSCSGSLLSNIEVISKYESKGWVYLDHSALAHNVYTYFIFKKSNTQINNIETVEMN